MSAADDHGVLSPGGNFKRFAAGKALRQEVWFFVLVNVFDEIAGFDLKLEAGASQEFTAPG